jgi:hypothetical protein
MQKWRAPHKQSKMCILNVAAYARIAWGKFKDLLEMITKKYACTLDIVLLVYSTTDWLEYECRRVLAWELQNE